jgi:hypothetical protein
VGMCQKHGDYLMMPFGLQPDWWRDLPKEHFPEAFLTGMEPPILEGLPFHCPRAAE